MKNTKPYALRGLDSMLFLGGDSNDSIKMFTTDVALTHEVRKSWQTYMESLKNVQSEFNIKSYAVLIAPSKEEIFPSLYPFPKAKNRLIDHFIREFKNEENLIWPKWELYNTRFLSYCTTDTHWTDYGAYIAALSLFKKWQIDKFVDESSFKVKHWIGDLGSKLDPMESSRSLVFSDTLQINTVFNNYIINNGFIKVIENASSLTNESLLIFGDSFGSNLSTALGMYFSKVIYSYQPAAFDPELISFFNPSYMLLQTNQRFINTSDMRHRSVLANACNKIKNFSEDQKLELKSKLLPYNNGEFSGLVQPLLRCC